MGIKKNAQTQDFEEWYPEHIPARDPLGVKMFLFYPPHCDLPLRKLFAKHHWQCFLEAVTFYAR